MDVERHAPRHLLLARIVKEIAPDADRMRTLLDGLGALVNIDGYSVWRWLSSGDGRFDGVAMDSIAAALAWAREKGSLPDGDQIWEARAKLGYAVPNGSRIQVGFEDHAGPGATTRSVDVADALR
jgi:hypothetical protein